MNVSWVRVKWAFECDGVGIKSVPVWVGLGLECFTFKSRVSLNNRELELQTGVLFIRSHNGTESPSQRG